MPTQNTAYLSVKPELQKIAWEIMIKLEEKGYKPTVAQGLRTATEEAAHVANGTSQTLQSYHCLGLAVDIVDEKLLWNIPIVHQFWWDYYQIASSLVVSSGHLRFGIVWDHPERIAEYKKALDAGQHTVPWFADVAHIELHLP